MCLLRLFLQTFDHVGSISQSVTHVNFHFYSNYFSVNELESVQLFVIEETVMDDFKDE